MKKTALLTYALFLLFSLNYCSSTRRTTASADQTPDQVVSPIISAEDDPSEAKEIIILQTFDNLTSREDVESYAEVYLDGIMVGTTSQKLLSQPKVFELPKSNVERELKLKIFIQDRYRKKWKPLAKEKQPGTFTIPASNKNGARITIRHTPKSALAFEMRTTPYFRKRGSKNKVFVSLSFEISNELDPSKNPQASIDVYLDKKKIGDFQTGKLSSGRKMEFSTSFEKHLLKLVIRVWDIEKNRWRRLRNIEQPPARYFHPSAGEKEIHLFVTLRLKGKRKLYYFSDNFLPR